MINSIKNPNGLTTTTWHTAGRVTQQYPHLLPWRVSSVDTDSATQSVNGEDLLFAWSLFQMYGTHTDNTESAVPRLTLPERLAALLLGLADIDSTTITGVSFQTLAEYLGTRRETVGAVLRAFARQGFVELGCNQIALIDIESLKEFGATIEWQ